MFLALGVLILVALVLMTACALIARFLEKKDWNNGYCTCGESWHYFDTDSQGGRGYKCNKCHKYIWISYDVDIRKSV